MSEREEQIEEDEVNNREISSEQKTTDNAKEAIVGDRILYDYRYCIVKKKQYERGSMRLIVQYDSGDIDNVPNDWNRYTIVSKEQMPASHKQSENESIYRKKKLIKRAAKIGDKVLRTSDNLIGIVVDIQSIVNGIEKLIIKLDDGTNNSIYNSLDLYRVIEE